MTTNIPAYTGEGLDDGSLQAPADWSGSNTNGSFQFRGVPTAGDPVIGVIQNAPALGEKVLLRFIGVTKAVAGAAVALGDPLQVDGNGCFITATTGHAIVAKALMPANAAKDVISVLLLGTPVNA
jgi:hypothetical protein